MHDTHFSLDFGADCPDVYKRQIFKLAKTRPNISFFTFSCIKTVFDVLNKGRDIPEHLSLIHICGKTEYKAELSTSPVGSMVKLENLFNGLHENIDLDVYKRQGSVTFTVIGNSNSIVWRLYFYFQGEKYRCTGRNFFNWFPAVL